ncbi:MAG: hypothetical protein HKO02_03725 [Hyphomonadaceae bacterium]|nr:hypothetical protein [Hyphomonadaceae bacterium]
MKTNFKKLTIAAIATVAFALSGCNTVQGVGDDIKSAGKKGEEVIKDVKN